MILSVYPMSIQTMVFGILLNPTEGLPGDTGEFFEPGYTVLDALTAQSYKQLNAVGDQKLIVPHSAGNNDLIKGLELTALNNEKLSNLHFLSVGSPVSHKKLSRAYAAVGANDLGQVNNLLDPVTYPRVVQVGLGVALLGATVATSYYVGLPLAKLGLGIARTGLKTAASVFTGGFNPVAPGLLPAMAYIGSQIGAGAVGVGAAGAAGAAIATPSFLTFKTLERYHPFVNGYLNKRAEVGGTIADWTKKHYPQHNYQFNLLPPPSYQPPETNIVP